MNNQDTRYIYKPVESRKDLQQFNVLINFIKKKKSRTFLFTWHSSDYYVTFPTSVHIELSNVRINLRNWKVNNYLRFRTVIYIMAWWAKHVSLCVLQFCFFSPTFNINLQLGSQKYRQHCNINTDWNLDAQIFHDCYSLLRQMKNTWLDGQMNAYCRSAQIKHIKYKTLYSY